MQDLHVHLVNLHTLHVQFVQKNKKYCNGKVYMKRHQNDSLKNIMVFAGLANQHCLGERGTAETGSYNNILKG